MIYKMVRGVRRTQLIKIRMRLLFLFTLLSLVFFTEITNTSEVAASGRVTVDSIPDWNGVAYIEINSGMPAFSAGKKKCTQDYVKYRPLDHLGRAGKAIGCLGQRTLNRGERENIGSIRPPGWETKKYPDLIRDRYVYNRCHLLMQAASAGMDSQTCNSERNLITGTRYMNVDGMLPFETELLSYLRSTNNHVLYRVTPIYEGKELVARGVQMEAWSVEDSGRGLKFNVFCYNIQPGIQIDYKSGKTSEKPDSQGEIAKALSGGAITVNGGEGKDQSKNNEYDISDLGRVGENSHLTEIYVLNTNTKKFHYPTCFSVNQMLDKNREIGHYSRDELLKRGYSPCGNCKP